MIQLTARGPRIVKDDASWAGQEARAAGNAGLRPSPDPARSRPPR